LKIISKRQRRCDILVKSAPEIIKLFWEEGFFKTEKTFAEIQSTMNNQGYNLNYATLYSAIGRADFLKQKGSVGHYRYIQKYNFDDHHDTISSNKLNGIELLKERKIHPKIIQVCGKLFTDGHFSQAIFEAFKAINIMVKEKSGLEDLDGKDLMTQAFKVSAPKLRWSNLITLSERNEQEGFMFLFMGAMVGIRNPKAHDHVIQKDEIKTLEFLSFASLLAKRIDEAKTVDAPRRG